MFSSEAWLANPSSGFYNGVATQSLRTDHITAKNLSRTPSSESNKRTFTFSTWFKRSFLDYSTSETVHQIFSSQVDGNDYFAIFFQDDGKLYVDGYHTQQKLLLVTNRLFRDTSAWYHLVVAVDTTQGTAANRIKIYVNGVQETSFSTETYPPQNYDTYINDDVKHTLASSFTSDGQRFGGYFAETNLVDGSQLSPTSFGETKNGVWIPKKYSGSYGTNGFRLQFDQVGVGTASSSTIGADTSGNNNHYTSSGIVASDCAMPDSPENNFCTLNGVAKSTSLTLSEGNLQTNTANKFALGTIAVNSGKWYFENYVNSTNGGFVAVYEADTGVYSTTIDDGGNNPSAYGYYSNGQKVRNGSFVNYGSAFTTAGDIVGVALDMDNGAVYFSVNGTWQNSATTSQISAGTTTNAAFTGLSGNIVARCGHYNNNNPTILNFGQDASFAGSLTGSNIGDETPNEGAGVFKYAPPSSFLALCTANLEETTISPNADTQADDHFNTILYTGNQTARSITGVGFQPDWVWFKPRSDADNHVLIDSSRGGTKYLMSNRTDAEITEAQGISSFNSDGFSIGNWTNINKNSSTYVGWNWKANGGTTSSNTDGDVTGTVQANATAGFSIVTYTSNNSNSTTVGHGMGVKPDIVIQKNRSATSNWLVLHQLVDGSVDYHLLDSTSAGGAGAQPASTTSTIATWKSSGSDTTGNLMVAYCFASIEGYSKFGSYTANNSSSDNAFVYLGFRPAFVLVKVAGASQEWAIVDNVRDSTNDNSSNILYPNYSNAESTDGSNIVDLLSNGFKIRATASFGYATAIYIYMAFAEAPFKYANAR